MPELPEVETVRLQLLNKVKGQTIKNVAIYHHKTTGYDTDFAKTLRGKTISHIDRIGKLLIFDFANEDNLFMLAHLKMTGQFFFKSSDQISGGGHSYKKSDLTSLPNKHTRVEFAFKDGGQLFFNDMRLFGYTKIVNAEVLASVRATYGPEPIKSNFPLPDFISRVRKRRTSIKAALLDQSLVAGLGNIYVDEALFMARVRPTRQADKLSKSEARSIIEAGGAVMLHSISVGGTTFQHFMDTEGHTGNFSEHLQIFGKQNSPCPKCGTLIKKIKVAGRGTHFCPQCQK